MDLQYISDTAGNHTAVIVPIEDWNKITNKQDELMGFNINSPKMKPSDFRGIISKNTATELLKYTENARKEWERDTF